MKVSKGKVFDTKTLLDETSKQDWIDTPYALTKDVQSLALTIAHNLIIAQHSDNEDGKASMKLELQDIVLLNGHEVGVTIDLKAAYLGKKDSDATVHKVEIEVDSENILKAVEKLKDTLRKGGCFCGMCGKDEEPEVTVELSGKKLSPKAIKSLGDKIVDALTKAVGSEKEKEKGKE